jgi:nickel superoxide dismutase
VEAESAGDPDAPPDAEYKSAARAPRLPIRNRDQELARSGQGPPLLWTDYFKPEHLETYPDLHELFWNATKEAGLAKKAQDPAQGQKLLDSIDEIGKIFWETKS